MKCLVDDEENREVLYLECGILAEASAVLAVTLAQAKIEPCSPTK